MNTVSIKGSMGDVADSGSVPIRKADIRPVPLDSKMLGNNLAVTVMARAVQDGVTWKDYAIELIRMDVLARRQFSEATGELLKEYKKTIAESFGTVDRDGKPNPTKDDIKKAAKQTASATNRISACRTIANGFNSGGDEAGLLMFAGNEKRLSGEEISRLTLADVTFGVIYEYAQKFNESKAGPKVKPWLDKLNKWLEENKGREDNETDAVQRDAVLAFVANLK